MIRLAIRAFSTTSLRMLKRISETTKGNVTFVKLLDVPDKPAMVFLKTASQQGCSICNCQLPVKLSYTDVLILEQFMREDGTVLPRELSGLCDKHQTTLEKCVMQAHWSGLFPDRIVADFDLSGYKRFKRWWRHPNEMLKLMLKRSEGSWHYIKRYNPKKEK